MVRSKQSVSSAAKATSSQQKAPIVCKGCSLPSPGSAVRCNYCGGSLRKASPASKVLMIIGLLMGTMAFLFWAASVPDPFEPDEHQYSSLIRSSSHLVHKIEDAAPSPFVARQPSTAIESRPNKVEASAPVMPSAKSDVETLPGKLTCGGSRTTEPDKTDFGPYIQQVQRLFRNQWHPPKSLESRNVSVSFAIACNGQILRPKILATSGVEAVDLAALDALKRSAPLPSLPETFQGRYVNVQFEFNSQVGSRQEDGGASSAPLHRLQKGTQKPIITEPKKKAGL